MSSYLDSLQQQSSRNARTENGALTHSTTHNAVLDFFALAGAMRDNTVDAATLFRKAFVEDEQLAVRALFYLRDIRGGQGERDLFRTLYGSLRSLDSRAAENGLKFIPEYGRWDDLLKVGAEWRAGREWVASLVLQQLNKDELAMRKGENVSLLAKWLPSENTSSKVTSNQARKLAEDLGWTQPEYRRRVVALRRYIKLLEHKMSANQWDEIDYEKLPSQAGRKHTKAFKRHDGQRYSEYLEAVMSGEKKMNAGTVFTYEVFDMIRQGAEKAADAMWKSLPDYTQGNNALVVADVSGSMMGRPMDVSVSLALYFAEHNTGAFKNYFITFSDDPKLQKVLGNTLRDRLRSIENSDWGMSTNIQKVFDLLLKAAQKAGADAQDVPKVIYIISDMEFNDATTQYSWSSGSTWSTHRFQSEPEETNFEAAERKFRDAGFELPHIVFWNVNARSTSVPTTKHDGRVTLISGLSQSTFRYAVENKSPEELMLEVLNSERYAPITV